MDNKFYLKLINSFYTNDYIDVTKLGNKEIEILMYHRLIGHLYKYLNKGLLNKNIVESVSNNYYIQKNLHEKYMQEVRKITACFNSNHIRYIFIKGFSLFNYYEQYTREFNDVDVIIDSKDIGNAINLLNNLGYVFGTINNNSNVVKLATRQEILFSRINTHEIFQLIKKVDNIYIKLDVNFLFQWKVFNNPQINFEELYSNININNEIVSLNIVYNILHLCCHFYNETVNFIFDYTDRTKMPRELKIFRLFDILLLINKLNFAQQNQIIFISEKHNIDCQIKYTLKVLNEFFPKLIPKYLYDFASSNPSNKDDVNIYMKENGELGRWNLTLYDRAFDFEKKKNHLSMMEL